MKGKTRDFQELFLINYSPCSQESDVQREVRGLFSLLRV